MTRRYLMVLLIVITGFITESRLTQTAANSPQGVRKFDEYTDVPSNDAKARLDNFAAELQSTPDAKGYIVAYGGSRCPNNAQSHANLARSYLVSSRGLDSARVIAVNGGRRSNARNYAVELWFVPQGASAPVPTPTLAKRCPR